ncbi:junctional adhesion molecule 2A isoform X2 [Onychostoma macrolepis]|uniref:junctional adhesion molecule 2A isoform X2 n=1 Tax=Onychostoma macrolepis TaxID=369639 RepID=UPI00272A2D55|nr:junctional adhesion molecule 2A isoform X2 [Onychostoma macrolepis]
MFLSVALLILIQSAPVVPVTVTSRSPGVEVHEFSDAELSCEFRTETDKNPRIEWKKIDKDVSFVYYDGSFVGSFQGRAEIKGATVRLRRVTQTDAGKYRCEVSAPQDTVTLGETNVTLTVLVPPHTPSCDVPSSALTGSLVQLRCRDRHSIPAAVYTWYKDNSALPILQANATYTINENTGVLTFQKVSRADTGQYHCEARNGVGPGKSCLGTRMQIDDLNVAAVVSGVVLLALLLFLCAFGGFYAHRHGLFSRHRGSQNSGYSHPPKEPQDFKHTQSFML